MSDEIRINRAPAQQPMSSQPQPEMTEPKSGKMAWIVLGVIVIVLIVVGVLFRGKLFAGKSMSPSGTLADDSGYEAVFLTNGQVYFGKLSHPDSDYPTLTDIYYLQVGPQQGSATAPTPSSSNPQQQISLVKLGNELHGPEDQMYISRSQILFYEDLKSSGQVVKAILQDKASAAAPAK